ncbi:[FeFe] hydrogenase H-cluster maturation GTPase HydF [Rhodovastum atsumiense]|uniref:[FeFe] hydrogenase H-cluster maturation GTPase HydF n=1 Tax=Rhodovastum atsumiense TaxID=504468 RepID=A0A5M6J180_9PROT|nr:[FeFe] hydrogenase H-cluster maturation GTPase HydF [Rhodovastum atsumiense]KAA5614271.1 [FeFe] hydrogenase H-cluster maturation GTPase HydF [Rhodovastum atsumiense]CAH2604725.1 [FeFe] hydrogenase H-cluster maturation GTPase HydF [Rhodovastum atsumiense]
MLETPAGLRLHIGVFGRRNVGKSSLVNALTGQSVSIVSDTPGTTTDPVSKALEMAPVGPVVFVDTAGFDDVGDLGTLRRQRTEAVLERVDVALLVCGPEGYGADDAAIVAALRAHDTPVLVVFNKSDLAAPSATVLELLAGEGLETIAVSAATGSNIGLLREAITRLVPDERLEEPRLVGDLVPAGDLAVLVVPIDLGAPKGRLILPQVQVIREILDSDAMCMVVKERELRDALARLDRPPRLVICDSQVVLKAAADTPPEVPLTTFSILMARFKGDLVKLARGAAAIHALKAGDRVLIAESCTHCPLADDIGRVKIPRWLRQFVGGGIEVDVVAEPDLPQDLTPYAIVIHCGACMLTRKHMLARLYRAERQGVPMTNYGVAISLLQGVLPRALGCFPGARAAYEAARRG